MSMADLLSTGCIYGQYSSLEVLSYDVIRYVGMTGTTRTRGAEQIADLRLKGHLSEAARGVVTNPFKSDWYQAVQDAGGTILCTVLAEAHDLTRRQLICNDCDLRSTGAGVANHQRLSGHIGRHAATGGLAP